MTVGRPNRWVQTWLWITAALLSWLVAAQEAEPVDADVAARAAAPAVAAALHELRVAGQPLAATELPAAPELTEAMNAALRFRAAEATLPYGRETPVSPYGTGSWESLATTTQAANAQQIMTWRETLSPALAGSLEDGYWGWHGGDWLGVSVKEMVVLRLAAALADMAWVEGEYGDRDRAYEHAVQLLALARSLRHDADMESQLLRLQVGRLASLTLLAVLARHDPDYVFAQGLVRTLRAERLDSPMGLAISHELVYTASRGLAAASPDPALSQQARAELGRYVDTAARPGTEPTAVQWDTAVAGRLHLLAAVRTAVLDPATLRTTEGRAAYDAVPTSWLVRRADAVKALPDLEGTYDAWLATVEAAFILRLHRLRTRSLPETAAAAADKLQTPWPTDPFDGEPLRYSRDDETHARTWSIGRNRRDDGGQAAGLLAGAADFVYRSRRELQAAPPASAASAPSGVADRERKRLAAAGLPTNPAALSPAGLAPAANAAEYDARAFAEHRTWVAAHRDLLAKLPYGGLTPWPDVAPADKLLLARAMLRDETGERLGKYATNATRHRANWRLVNVAKLPQPPPPLAGPALGDACRQTGAWLSSRAVVAAHYARDNTPWTDLGAALHLSHATASETDFAMVLIRLRQGRVALDALSEAMRVAQPDEGPAGYLVGQLRAARTASILNDLLRRDVVDALQALDRDRHRRPLTAMTLVPALTAAEREAGLMLVIDEYLAPTAFWEQQYSALFDFYLAVHALADADHWERHKQFRESLSSRDFGCLSRGLRAMYADLALQEAGIDARLTIAETAIALRLYQRRNGAFPDRLQSLSPTFLPTAPLDPFDGNLLRYSRSDAGFELRSVGPDRHLSSADEADADDLIWSDSGSLAPRDADRLRDATP